MVITIEQIPWELWVSFIGAVVAAWYLLVRRVIR